MAVSGHHRAVEPSLSVRTETNPETEVRTTARRLGELLWVFTSDRISGKMSKIEMLRLLISQRLTSAAEEIFGAFGRTVAEYEDEISRFKLEIERQRRLLDLSRTPQISVHADSSGEKRTPQPEEGASEPGNCGADGRWRRTELLEQFNPFRSSVRQMCS